MIWLCILLMLSSCTISFLPPIPEPESIVLCQEPDSDGYPLGFNFTSNIFMSDGSVYRNIKTQIDSSGFTDIVNNGQAIRYGTAVIRSYTIVNYQNNEHIYSQPISITINDINGDWNDGIRILNFQKIGQDELGQYGTWECGVDSGDYSIAHNTTIVQFNGSWTDSCDFSSIEINADGSIFTR